MQRRIPALFGPALLVALILADASCAARKWPGIRGPRAGSGGNESAEQPAEEGATGENGGEYGEGEGGYGGYEESGSSSNGSENVFVETELPGERVELIDSAPPVRDFEFRPEPQTRARAASASAADAAPPGQHPRLYFDDDELRALQAKANGSHRQIAQRIFAFGDRTAGTRRQLPPEDIGRMPKGNGTWRKEGDKLLGMAAAYALQTDTRKKAQYLDWIVESMRRLATFQLWGPSAEYHVGLDGAHILFGFSVAYDVVHDTLNAAEQEKFAERIRDQARAFYRETQGRDPEFWATGYTTNHNYINHNALLNAALAVQGRFASEAADWIRQVEENTEQVMTLRALVGDGSTTEGVMYGTYGSHGLFPTLALLRKHGYANHYDNPWLEQHFHFLLHGSMPGFSRVVGIADSHGTYGHGPQHLLYFLDQVMQDGRPTWVANRVSDTFGRTHPYGKPEGSPLLFEYLWYDGDLEPRPITIQNTDGFHYFDDWGVVTMRRGWTQGSSFFRFKAGDPAGEAMWGLMLADDPRTRTANVSHSHPDAGSFSFHPGGRNFIAGALYAKPKRTALNNTYTFTPSFPMAPPVPMDIAKQIWDPSQLDQVGRLDEVGQSGEWGQWMGPLRKLLRERPDADVISVIEEKGAVFVSGEIGEAYPDRVAKRGGGQGPLGVERVYRNMLLLPEDLLVIVDRVETRGPVQAHCYFRALATPRNRTQWQARGARAVLDGGEASGGEVIAVHPSGMRIETGREIYSYEDAKGENRQGIDDWYAMSHHSVFARFSNPDQNGVQTYVYLVRPAGVDGSVSDVQASDPRGVAMKIETETRVYDARIALQTGPAARRGFLGHAGWISLDFAVKE